MIITIKNADFSTKNIGALSTWTILTNLGSGTTYSGNRLVDKGGSLSATITIDNGYELGSAGVSVIMGGTDVTSSASTFNGNTITISIAAVTGNVTIIVPTLITGGEETPNYTFTINPTPSNASVILTASGYTQSGNSITVPNGTAVSWSVSASGYTVQTGSWTANGENKTENIILSATSGGGSGALDLNSLTLAHCSSSKLSEGTSKENLVYNPVTNDLTVNNSGWYKVSYFTTPIQVGTEIEFSANYSTSMTGNFIGLYLESDLSTDGVAERGGSFWPGPTPFGIYASGSSAASEPMYLWNGDTPRVAVVDRLATDFNGKTVKLQMFADGVKVFVEGDEIVLPRPCPLTAGTNYYLGFHNNCTNPSTVAQTIEYIGPIR